MLRNSLNKIDTRSLFYDITRELLELLPGLSDNDWQSPTCYPAWTVKDIVSHLLQGAISRLSFQRDRFNLTHKAESIEFAALADIIDRLNDNWNTIFKNISPKIIIDLVTIMEKQLADFFLTEDLEDEACYAVTWAGETVSENWFDIAREFTERWHHQQQIREAVGAHSIATKKYLEVVIDILIRAIPYWYAPVQAECGFNLKIVITGESGGNWVLQKNNDQWLLSGYNMQSCDDEIVLSDDTAWRLFTRTISKEEAKNRIVFSSKKRVCTNFLNVKAIMIND